MKEEAEIGDTVRIRFYKQFTFKGFLIGVNMQYCSFKVVTGEYVNARNIAYRKDLTLIKVLLIEKY